MRRILCFICWAGFSLHLAAQPATPLAPDIRGVESTWPGIQMQVLKVERIAGNRLLVEVRIQATAKAPPSTLIGYPPVIPPNATPEDLKNGFGSSPFSLEPATMMEEQTRQKYGTLAPDPQGPSYLTSVVMTSLSPGAAQYMTIQFPAPPPPAPDETGRVPVQTVSFFLPKTQGPVTKVVVPPPTMPPPAR